MATSDQCNQAWKNGFIDGYRSIKSTTPSIPSRPASHPASVDPVKYYYNLGYEHGVKAAK